MSGCNGVQGSVRHVKVTDFHLCGVFFPYPLFLRIFPHLPGQDPLHLVTLLSDLKPQGQKA